MSFKKVNIVILVPLIISVFINFVQYQSLYIKPYHAVVGTYDGENENRNETLSMCQDNTYIRFFNRTELERGTYEKNSENTYLLTPVSDEQKSYEIFYIGKTTNIKSSIIWYSESNKQMACFYKVSNVPSVIS